MFKFDSPNHKNKERNKIIFKFIFANYLVIFLEEKTL